MMSGCSCEHGCLSCDPSGEYDYQFVGNRWVLLPVETHVDNRPGSDCDTLACYGCEICDPHGCTNYMFKDNERYSCPHPECGSHDYADSPNTAVRVEGGEDFCEHPSCTWVEGDGVHFATAAEICFCGGLIREHTKEEAQGCLESLILNGIKGLDTEAQINEVMAYESDEVIE